MNLAVTGDCPLIAVNSPGTGDCPLTAVNSLGTAPDCFELTFDCPLTIVNSPGTGDCPLGYCCCEQGIRRESSLVRDWAPEASAWEENKNKARSNHHAGETGTVNIRDHLKIEII